MSKKKVAKPKQAKSEPAKLTDVPQTEWKDSDWAAARREGSLAFVYGIKSASQAAELFALDVPEDLVLHIAKIVGLDAIHTDALQSITCDAYVLAVAFARSAEFSALETAALFTLMHRLFENIRTARPTLQQQIEFVEDLLIACTADDNTKGLPDFSPDSLKKLAVFLAQGPLLHHDLYLAAFHDEKPFDPHEEALCVQTLRDETNLAHATAVSHYMAEKQEELLTSLKGRTLSAQQKKVILTATVSNFVEEAKASVEEDVESSIAILMSRLRLNSGGDVLSQTTHSTNAN